jgi:NADPH:quinone reductase-like Zn-dependent oxidoreductase
LWPCGGPDVMKYQNMPDTLPGVGDVLVRWQASSRAQRGI